VIRLLLAHADLPTADVAPEVGRFVVAEEQGEIVGTAGVECYGTVGLLRSVATSPAVRGQGIALRLCAEAICHARETGVRELYLLTTTAPGFFERLGFQRLARVDAPDTLRESREFRELCPASSVLMRKPLDAVSADAAPSRVRIAYEQFLRGEPSTFIEMLDPGAVYHLPGGHMGGGRLQGREAIFGRVAAALQAYDASPTVRVLAARGDDSVVLTSERYTGRRGIRRLDQQVCVVWRLEHDRCVELWAHFESQDACDAFWAGWRATD